jgi:O-antigen ligase
VAILEYYLGVYIVGSAETTGYRAEGLTGDPNGFALNLLFVFPFLAYQLTAAPDIGRKLLTAGLLAVNLAAMVATMSRSGGLLLAVLAPTLFLASSVRVHPRALGFIFLGVMVAVVAIAISVPDEYWERQQTLVAGERDNAMSRRGAYVTVAGRAFVESPVLGHGLGAFKYIFSKTPEAAQYDKGNVSDRVRDAHNTYLEVLVGLGILGLGAFLLLLGTAIRNFFRAFKGLRVLGDELGARLALHYLIAFVTLLSYLTFFSDVHHKFVLLMLAVSVLWQRESQGSRTP